MIIIIITRIYYTNIFNCVISNVSITLERYLNLISLFIINSYKTHPDVS